MRPIDFARREGIRRARAYRPRLPPPTEHQNVDRIEWAWVAQDYSLKHTNQQEEP